MNCPCSDTGVKGEPDVQALVSLLSYFDLLYRILVSTTYDT